MEEIGRILLIPSKIKRSRMKRNEQSSQVFQIRKAMFSCAVFLHFSLFAAVAYADAENRVCNKSSDIYYYARIFEDASQLNLRCELGRQDCQVVMEGWFKLDPGQCDALPIGSRWTTYLAIYREGSNGEPHAAKYKVDLAFFKNRERNTTGLLGVSICAKFEYFKFLYNGTINDLLDNPRPCADGYQPISVNMAMRTEPSATMVADLY